MSWKLKWYKRREKALTDVLVRMETDRLMDMVPGSPLDQHLKRVSDRAERRLTKIQLQIAEMENRHA